jgi:uncharacterized protein YqeY
MGLKETLKSDLTEAIRSSDKVVSGTIRMVLTAITNEEVAGKEARVLTDEEIITVLSREAKKRREAAEEFAKANRPDKSAEEKAEGEVIAKYLPAQLSEDDIKKNDCCRCCIDRCCGTWRYGQGHGRYQATDCRKGRWITRFISRQSSPSRRKLI